MAQAQQREQRPAKARPQYDERYGVTHAEWAVLCDAIFPSAKTAEAIGMALDYCKARKLDIFKKPVHIVPVWSSAQGRMIESVWPGISELRTTAARTRQYAGCGESVFGPDVEKEFAGEYQDERGDTHNRSLKLTVPSWCQITVWRLIENVRCPFVGPKVFWDEIYASTRNSKVPNDRWQRAPRGQLEKCAEAAALRRAFPEEIGNDYTAEEMEGKELIEHESVTPKPRLVVPSPEEATRAIEHKPAVPIETEPVREKELVQQEPVYVERAGRARKATPADQPRQEPETVDLGNHIDPAKWLEDVRFRMKDAKTAALLDEVYGEVQDRQEDVPPEAFQQAEDCYLICKAQFDA